MRKEIRTHTERKKSKSEVSHNVIEKKYEKSNSGDKYGHIKNNFRFLFFRYLCKKIILNGDKSTKSVNIPVNNNTN